MDKRDTWIKGLTYCFMVPLAVVFMVNTFISALKSTYFQLNMENEVPSYQDDCWQLMLVGMFLLGALIFVVYRRLEQKQIKGKVIAIAACIWAAIACLCTIFIFRCGVVADAASVSTAAIQFMEGNYEALYSGYLRTYSFQIGLLAFFEVVYRLFGVENYIAFQLFNTAAITGVVYLLPHFVKLLFKDEGLVKLTAVLSTILFPLFLYSTFIYGDIPGFALGALAVYYGIRYLQEDRIKYAVFAGLLFMLALPIKGNNLIFVVAAVIGIFLKMLQEKRAGRLLGIMIILILSQLGNTGVKAAYAKRAGLEEFPTGVPMVAWMAMGLQEAKEQDNGCGWYNGYNNTVYSESNYDYDLAWQKSIESIKASIERFISDPGHAVYYFYRKFTSQWNDPTYQAQLMNEWYSRHVENPSKLSDFFLYGRGRGIVFEAMNVVHLVIFAFSGIGAIVWIRRWSLERAYYLLNIFGGVIFHTLVWEAKGRYVLPYYVLMIPVAAAGVQWLFANIPEYAKKIRKYIYERKISD